MNKPREEEKRKLMVKCAEEADKEQRKLVEKSLREEEKESWVKEYDRKYAPLMAKIDEYYWQKGYPKLENDLRKFISQALKSQLKEVEERIFQDANIPAEVCKYIREKVLAKVEKLV